MKPIITFNQFVLKYPEVVKQVQNLVFPYTYNDFRAKDAKELVQYLIESNEEVIVDLKVAQESKKLYEIHNELFYDYKDFEKDLINLLSNIKDFEY